MYTPTVSVSKIGQENSDKKDKTQNTLKKA